jgi:hypothetical protein
MAAIAYQYAGNDYDHQTAHEQYLRHLIGRDEPFYHRVLKGETGITAASKRDACERS